jgi:hypothetical protein
MAYMAALMEASPARSASSSGEGEPMEEQEPRVLSFSPREPLPSGTNRGIWR